MGATPMPWAGATPGGATPGIARAGVGGATPGAWRPGTPGPGATPGISGVATHCRMRVEA